MKASDLIDEIGTLLQEDFTYAPVWTQDELLKYLQQTVNEFALRTLLVDGSYLSPVNATTGEASVPARFHTCYYTTFNNARVDVVNLSELDFVSQTWSLGATAATPLGATIYGAGNNAKVKYIPVPSTVSGAYATGTLTSLTVSDSGGNVWTVTCTGGALVTTAGGTATSAVVIAGPTTFWDLGVSLLGVLTLTASASTAGNEVILDDSLGTGSAWQIRATDAGALLTSDITRGTVVAIKVDDVYQTMTAGGSASVNYGCVFDLYATGVSTTPATVARLDGPVGTTHIVRSSDYTADIWCKLNSLAVPNTSAEVPLNTCFLPIIKHGVLAMAYGHPYEGHDSAKSKLLRSIFIAECETIKRIFGRR